MLMCDANPMESVSEVEDEGPLSDKWKCPKCCSTNPPYRETVETVRFKRMCTLDDNGIIDGYGDVYDSDPEDIEADYICCSDCEWYKEIT